MKIKNQKKFISLSVRIITVLCAFMIFTISLSAYFSYQKAHHLLTEDAFTSMEENLKHTQNILEREIQTIQKDVLLLSEVPPIDGIIRSLQSNGHDSDENTTGILWEKNLQTIFVTILKSKPEYTQIRFIGDSQNGKEIVRVNRTSNGIVSEATTQLQEKGGKDYFQKTKRLGKGKIYISEINLNREKGEIVMPYQPMLRIAAPIYDKSNGQFFGIVIININIDSLFHKVFKNRELYFYKIVNEQGFYIFHPDLERIYGFELGKNHKLQNDYPQMKDLFLPSDKSDKEPTVKRFNLFQHKRILIASKLYFDEENLSRFLLISLVGQQKIISEYSKGLGSSITVINIAVMLLLVIVVLLSVRKGLKPLKALSSSAKNITKGFFPTNALEIKQNDEIGELTNSFNEMIENLKVSTTSIKALNEEVSERKKVESELEKTIKGLKDIKFAIDEHAIVVIADAKGKITYANDQFCEISEYSKDEVIGQDQSMFHSNFYSKKSIRDIGTTIINGKIWHGEIKNKSKGGVYYWVDTTIVPFLNANGEVHQYLAICTDISKVKAAEETSRREEKEAILLKNISNFGNKYESVNNLFQASVNLICQFLHWPVGHVYKRQGEKLVSLKLWYLKDEQTFKHFKEVTNRIDFDLGVGLPGRVFKSKKFEWIADVTKDKNFPRQKLAEIEVRSAFAIPVMIRNEVAFIIEFYNDRVVELNNNIPNLLSWISIQLSEILEKILSKQKFEESHRATISIMEDLKKEKELISALSKKAQASAKAKSDFLANMSHEIRTPMNAILGFSDLLRKTPLNEKQAQYLNTVSASGKLLVGIIDDILDISKLESGKIQLEIIDVNLNDLIFEVMRMVVTCMKDKPFDTFIDIDEKIPTFVKTDSIRLRQVLVNLLGNAVKFTSKGEIGVIVKLLEEKGDTLVLEFTVKDTGIGIPKDKLGSIFQSFTQADETTTRKYGGTGLGLTISKAIVETMGGEIVVKSEVGQGSRFVFFIPTRKSEQRSKEKLKLIKPVQLKYKKVFIVDDNLTSQKTIGKCCEKLDLKIVGVSSSPYEALNKLDKMIKTKGFIPDIILSDIMMEGMSGVEMVKKIKSNKRFKDTTFIAVTADLSLETSLDASDKVFNAFVTKPVSLDALTSAFNSVTGPAICNPMSSHKAKDESQDCAGIKILVAEDSLPNQMLMKAYFSELGCEAEYAYNGQEVIDKLRAGKTYDVCLMDLQMPVMGGIDATQVIRSEISKDLPIIALSAAVFEEDRKQATEVGMNDFLAKPIAVEKLKEKVLRYGRPKG